MCVDEVLLDLPLFNRESVLEVVVSWDDKSAKVCVCSGLATKYGALQIEEYFKLIESWVGQWMDYLSE
jgi:hypothetical protein